jgi:hypothetical protein
MMAKLLVNGAPEERTCPITETRIFIEQLERLPLQLIPPVYPTANRILWAISEELWRPPRGDDGHSRSHPLLHTLATYSAKAEAAFIRAIQLFSPGRHSKICSPLLQCAQQRAADPRSSNAALSLAVTS